MVTSAEAFVGRRRRRESPHATIGDPLTDTGPAISNLKTEPARWSRGSPDGESHDHDDGCRARSKLATNCSCSHRERKPALAVLRYLVLGSLRRHEPVRTHVVE